MLVCLYKIVTCWPLLRQPKALQPSDNEDINNVDEFFGPHYPSSEQGAKNTITIDSFVDENGNLVGIQTVKGQVDETSEDAYHLVDGISGATMTSRGLNQFLLKDLKFYDPFFSKIRSKWSG